MKRKILSFALACLMIMTAFATIVSAETAPFTVTGNDVGESADCTTWADALAKVYEYGGGTIKFNSDYTMVSTDKNSGTSNINITIDGNNKTLTDNNGADIFNFANGEVVIVNKLNINSTWKRIELSGGADLTLDGCTWVGQKINDEKGYIRTNAGTSFDTTVTIRNCKLWLYGGATVFANTSPSGRGLNVNLISSSINDPNADGYSENTGSTIYGLTYQIKNINISDSTVCSAKRMFRGLSNANINITGSSKLINTDGSAEFFNVTGTGTTNITVGKDACLINNGAKWYGISGSATEKLSFNTADLDFLKTSSDKGANTTTVALNYALPTMEAGASVRTTAPTGIRFTSMVAENESLISYGTLVSLTSNLTDCEFMSGILAAKGIKTYVEVVGEKKVINDGKITYNAVLTGISDYNTEFSARAYATYKYSDTISITVYSDYDEADNSRSIAFVASRALGDLKTQAQVDADPAVKAAYMCRVTVAGETMYSRYDANQREVLATIADGYAAN